jgi:very-short-patch-repair endonuclease
MYVLDFFCAERRLVVEVDGSIHDRPEQRERDAARTEYLQSLGYRVLRVRNETVLTNLDTVLTAIAQAAKQPEVEPADIDNLAPEGPRGRASRTKPRRSY